VHECVHFLSTNNLLYLIFRSCTAIIRALGLVEQAELRSRLASNVVLSGGTTSFPGLDARLLYELKRLKHKHCGQDDKDGAGGGLVLPWRIEPPHDGCPRKYTAWQGGAILASLPSLGGGVWWSKAAYDEVGPHLARRTE